MNNIVPPSLSRCLCYGLHALRYHLIQPSASDPRFRIEEVVWERERKALQDRFRVLIGAHMERASVQRVSSVMWKGPRPKEAPDAVAAEMHRRGCVVGWRASNAWDHDLRCTLTFSSRTSPIRKSVASWVNGMWETKTNHRYPERCYR